MRQLVKQKPYCGIMIGLQKVAVTCSVQVYDISELTSNYLALYFESVKGVDDAEVELHADDGYAIVHFADSAGKNILRVFFFLTYHALL